MTEVPTPPADLSTIADAFSRTAERYDGFVGTHPHLTRMREQVYATVARHVPACSRILELNAGTGIDAVELGLRGYTVHASDVAPGMLQRIQPKVDAQGLGNRVTVEARSYFDLAGMAGAPFDAVLSNFGGLNCTNDLARVGAEIRSVLHPKGIAILVVMPPTCLWELIRLFTGDVRLAFRRRRRGGTPTHLEGRFFTTYYYRPQALCDAFVGFERVEVTGLSVITPTAQSINLPSRYPTFYRSMCLLDDRLATKAPWSGWGDFAIIVLRRIGDSTSTASDDSPVAS